MCIRDRSSSIRDFDIIIQPKLNLFYDASDQITFFASYGRTFQAPIGSALFETGAGNYDVNFNDGGEIGIAYQPNEESKIRLSFWNQVAENEYQVDQIGFTGYREIGKVDRRGVELAFSYDVSDQFTFWGNYAYSMSKIKKASAVFPLSLIHI